MYRVTFPISSGGFAIREEAKLWPLIRKHWWRPGVKFHVVPFRD